MLLAEGDREEGAKARDNVVRKPLSGGNGDDTVLIGLEGRPWNYVEEVLNTVALIGKHEARSVKAVAAEQTADAVGDEIADGISCEETAVFLLCARRALVGCIAEVGVGGQGDPAERNLNGLLSLKVVHLGPVAIVLSLQLLSLTRGVEGVLPPLLKSAF